jgi:hypothetical protein
VEGVRKALNTVLSELHKVLYKQLLAWLLQGNLYDPYQVLCCKYCCFMFGKLEMLLLGAGEGSNFTTKNGSYRDLP